MNNLKDITKPQFIIDKEKMLNNVEKMVKKAKKNEINLRPHVKTHQSLDIANFYYQYGITRIAVSSIDMARYFMTGGWQDIIVCVPLNTRQIPEIKLLQKEYPNANLQVLCENMPVLKALQEQITDPLGVWLEIDTGYHRTGIDSSNIEEILELVKYCEVQNKLVLVGILTHAGHSYQAQSSNEIRNINTQQIVQMRAVKYKIFEVIKKNVKVSIGDTPTCSIIDEFDEIVDEIRPGNFIFYDVAQHLIGSCEIEEIAGAVVCPVIAKYPEREKIIVYGGSIHFSAYHGKHTKLPQRDDQIYGLIVDQAEDNTWNYRGYDVYLNKLSQEHGQISAPKEYIDQINIGDLLYILPFHACTAANLYLNLISLKGEIWSTFAYRGEI